MTAAFVVAAAVVALVGVLDSTRAAEAIPGDPQQVVFANWNVGASPRICTNNGTGDFGGCQSIPVVGPATDASAALASGDFDEDGLLDLVIGMQNGTINLCLGSVADTWSCAAHGANARHRAAVVDDFNGDGNLDIVASIETQTNMAICLGNGAGGLTCTQQWAPTGGGVLAAADVTGDGHVDLLYPSNPGPTALCTNDGNAAFTCVAMTGVPATNGAALGDLDADGELDVVFSSETANATRCLGNGAGAFTCASFGGSGGRAVGLADLDADGNLDALLLNEAAPSQTCLGNGAGGLTCQPITGIGAQARSMDLTDTDGDGDVDVVVGRAGDNQACINNGSGDFTCIGSDNNTWHTAGTLVLGTLAPPPPPPDTDGDGLTDDDETNLHGTNPALADTDGDGLSDGDEVNVHGTDPLDANSDGDSLSDGDEVDVYGTDPLSNDTDGDGLGDGAEVNIRGTDPTNPDTDGDGLSDGAEVLTHGTDPLDANSDGDSLSDGDEVDVYGTDPLSSDTDGDGLGDGAEVNIRGTDPTNPDTDGDGLSDGAEVQIHETDPLLADTDGDGIDDGIEVADGTNPRVPPGGQEIDLAAPGQRRFDRGPFTVSAVADSGRAVAITASGTCTIDAGTVTPIGAGICIVEATQPGGGEWLPAEPVTREITIAKGVQRIEWELREWVPLDGESRRLRGQATSGLAVRYTADGPCRVDGQAFTVRRDGACVITATQPGDADWLAADPVSRDLAIGRTDQTITFATPDTAEFGEAVELIATATSALPVGFIAAAPCSVDGSRLSSTAAGTCAVSAVRAGTQRWFDAAPVHRQVTITAATATLTVGDVVVDAGDAAQPAVVATEPAGLDGVRITYAGEPDPPTEPGTYPIRAVLEHPGYVAEPVRADYVVVEPPASVPVGFAAQTITAEALVSEGLPLVSGDGLALTVIGFDPATVATARSGTDAVSGTADTDGVMVLVFGPDFDAAEATIEVTSPDGVTATVSTEDVIAIGDTLVEVTIEVGPGPDDDELANTDPGSDTAGSTLGSVVVRANGLKPGGGVEVTVYSTPVIIGALTADDDGTVEAELGLPDDLPPGEHRIVLVGERDEGPVSGSWFFTVGESGTIETVGDPDPDPDPDPEPIAVAAGETDDEAAAASVDDAPPEDLAAVQIDRGIDQTTGLPTFDPVDEPEEAVETGVTAFAMLTALSAGAGMTALAAVGSAGSAAGAMGTSMAAGGGSSPGSGDGDGGSAARGRWRRARPRVWATMSPAWPGAIDRPPGDGPPPLHWTT